MRKTLTLLFISFITNYPAYTQQFSGTWVSKSIGYTFSIELIQKKNIIVGKYCAVLEGGAIINCDDLDKCQGLRGKLKNNTLSLDYKCYYDERIKAKVLIQRINDSSIEWKIVKPLLGKEYLVPVRDTLFLKTFNKKKRGD